MLHPFSLKLILRKIVGALAVVVLPCRRVEQAEHILQAEQMLNEGNGLVVLLNHFSLRDSFQVVCWLFRNKVAGRLPIVAPVAFHQHGPTVQFIADLLAVRLCPIVTSKTMQLGYSGQERGTGIRSYLNSAVDNLSEKGIVLLAPQGGRKSRLGRPAGRPIGSILAQARKRRVQNFGILIFALSIPGVSSYDRESTGGVNLFRRYGLRIGKPFRAGEVVDLAGGIAFVDSWIFQKFSKLIPVSYRNPLPKTKGAETIAQTADIGRNSDIPR